MRSESTVVQAWLDTAIGALALLAALAASVSAGSAADLAPRGLVAAVLLGLAGMIGLRRARAVPDSPEDVRWGSAHALTRTLPWWVLYLMAPDWRAFAAIGAVAVLPPVLAGVLLHPRSPRLSSASAASMAALPVVAALLAGWPDALAALAPLGAVALQAVAARRLARALAVRDADFADLERLRAQLERRLGAQAEEHAAALRGSQERARFLAAASHDLRQPIHAIGLLAGALGSEPLPARAAETVDRLARALGGLDELFKRLLDISLLDTGQAPVNLREFPLTPLAQTLESRFGPVAQQRGIRFAVHCGRGLAVRSDATLLPEMLMNLLSNAFRYTPSGGVLLAFRPAGDRVRLQVIDTGPGIPEADRQRIFEEFVQLSNPSHDRRKGLGLGLSIVRRLSSLLDHPLRLRSRLGNGSCFELLAPRVRLAEALPPALPDDAAASMLAGAMVLAADDETDVLAGMQSVLDAWGCLTLLARSPEEAAAAVQESLRFPDVIVTDYALGGGRTGFDLVEAVESLLPEPVPVLVLSGSDDPALARRVQERGWTWLLKPAPAAQLAAELAGALARAGRTDDA